MCSSLRHPSRARRLSPAREPARERGGRVIEILPSGGGGHRDFTFWEDHTVTQLAKILRSPDPPSPPAINNGRFLLMALQGRRCRELWFKKKPRSELEVITAYRVRSC